MHYYDIQNSFIFLTIIAIGFLFLTHFTCVRWFKGFPASAASGSVIMSLALYVGECLPLYGLPLWLEKLLMIEVLIIWVYGSFNLLYDFFLKENPGEQSDRFGFSAWIVATAMVAIMVAKVAPLLHGTILLLLVFALLLWFKYALMVCRAVLIHISNKFRDYVCVSLLLGAAATASIAWMIFIVFQNNISTYFYQTALIASFMLYTAIFIMVIRQLYLGNKYYLSVGWDIGGVLVFGATAVIGTVAIILQVANGWELQVLWLWSIIWFLILSLLAIGRVTVKVAAHGFKKILLIYDTRLWLCFFSYCMLYIFTRHYSLDHYSNNYIAVIIAKHGLNVITALLVLHIIYMIFAARLVVHES